MTSKKTKRAPVATSFLRAIERDEAAEDRRAKRRKRDKARRDRVAAATRQRAADMAHARVTPGGSTMAPSPFTIAAANLKRATEAKPTREKSSKRSKPRAKGATSAKLAAKRRETKAERTATVRKHNADTRGLVARALKLEGSPTDHARVTMERLETAIKSCGGVEVPGPFPRAARRYILDGRAFAVVPGRDRIHVYAELPGSFATVGSALAAIIVQSEDDSAKREPKR